MKAAVNINSKSVLTRMRFSCVIAVSFFLFGAVLARADDPSIERDALAQFEQHVRPILVSRCLKCHGSEKQKGELRLDTRQSLLTGGESGAAIEPGDGAASLLISAIRYDSLEMPPDGQLSQREIAAVEKWIERGAAWPVDAMLSAGAPAIRKISGEDRQHWSIQPIRDPGIPTIADDDWSLNVIDQFVFAKMHPAGVTPAPAAGRRTLARRLYFDLVGLPPTPGQVEQFVSNRSPTAYEDLVDTLLASPAYGERWARHWLDLVRYAESDGYKQDAYRPNAWRYRDYVIDAFNDDMPYDQFIREQLAGDELAPNDPSVWIATGYLRLHLYEYNQRDVMTQRQDILNEITDVTADVFLGLGLRCARCHDHKFDPILQTDYYRLQSFFAAMMPRDDVPIAPSDVLANYSEQQTAWEMATADLRAEIAELKRPYASRAREQILAKFPPDIKSITRKTAGALLPKERQIMDLVNRQIVAEQANIKPKNEDKRRIEELEKKLARFDHLRPRPLPTGVSVTDTGPIAPPTVIPGRGSAEEYSDDHNLVPGALVVLGGATANIKPLLSSPNTTGRRAALADWLTDPSNPLPARVVVNRIWQHHFGHGLVATSSDFGRLGKPPTHPDLLDWLASRFVSDGWHWKPVHRLILTSATYRQSADNPRAEQLTHIDPENKLRWRWDVRRLAAEQLQDSLLSVSGQLDSELGGASREKESARRAIYRRVYRNRADKLLGLFDLPDGINSMPERPVTTTPTQALAMFNGPWGTKTATAMADRIFACGCKDAENAVEMGYRLAFGRSPTTDESELAQEFIAAEQGSNVSDTSISRAALIGFCHVLLNSNEFLYID